MTSEGLGEMFEGYYADMCSENFRWCRWGAEGSVERAQTWERGPPSASVEYYSWFYILWCNPAANIAIKHNLWQQLL